MLCVRLLWSVEPAPGWPGKEHPYTGEVTDSRLLSRGWTDAEKTEHARLRANVQVLSLKDTGHPF